MAIIRSYVNSFEVVDRTQDLLLIPNQWGLAESLGLFASEGVSQNTITIEKTSSDAGLLLDRVRGERNNYNKGQTREIHAFPIPHFNLDDAILPEDIQGKRAYGSDNAEVEAAVRARKMERIRMSHAWTKEYARMQALTAGTVYAPNGTVSVNWFTSFGVTQKTVDFDLGTSTTEITAKIEEVIAHIQDNIMSGENISEFVVLCSPTWFAKLIKHPKIVAAYQYYSSVQEPLRTRLQGGPDVRYRQFEHGGVRFIEYRGSYAGNAMIPTGEAVAVPLGTMDCFASYYGPANKMDLVNTIGQEAYYFEYPDAKGGMIEIQSETNFINVLRRPQVVVKVTSST